MTHLKGYLWLPVASLKLRKKNYMLPLFTKLKHSLDDSRNQGCPCLKPLVSSAFAKVQASNWWGNFEQIGKKSASKQFLVNHMGFLWQLALPCFHHLHKKLLILACNKYQ